jgi:clan AA aspartic protease (TIGR02281 family)
MPTRALLALLVLAPLSSARADVVYLKNGNRMEGVITSRTKERVTLDFGYGSTIIDASEIERIERAKKAAAAEAGAQLRRRRYEAGTAVPDGAEKLDELYHRAQSLREQALDARAQEGELSDEAAAIQQELPDLKESYRQGSNALQRYNAATDPRGYNEQIGKINQAGVKIQADEMRAQEIDRLKTEAQGKVHAYIDSYRALEDYAEREGKGVLSQQGDYAQWLRGELQVMAADFHRQSVGVEKAGNSLIVNVLLNGKVPARLLVDTGASTTLLYKEVTERLAVPPEAVVGASRSTVADGRTLEGTVVRLDSIAVGKSVARGTLASVVPIEGQGFDGLLGMSFLGRFITRVDAANAKLILEDLKAP